MEITENTLVKLHYVGTLDDGSVFDSSKGREPLEFMFGVGMIIPGLESGIKGLKKGDKKKVKVLAKDAYGEQNPEAIQEVPRANFPKDMKLEVGMQLAAQSPHGVIPVRVAEIKKDSVMIDFNHMLAGKNLTFDVEIVEVKTPTKEDLAKLMGHGGSGCGSGCDSCGGGCH